MRNVAVLFVHGIGAQHSDYADPLERNLTPQLAKLGIKAEYESVFWAPELDGMEAKLLEACVALGARNTMLRRLAISTLADALAYMHRRPVLARVQTQVADGLERLYAPWRRRVAPGTPLFVLAHSLGGLVFADYLHTPWLHDAAFGIAELRGFLTFGCNIPLFSVGRQFKAPPLGKADWVNLFDADDFLGYPLRVLPELQHVRDIQVNVGTLLTWWNGFCHMEYWTDRSFSRAVAREIAALAGSSGTAQDPSRMLPASSE